MRTCTIILAAFAALLVCTEYVSAMEVCVKENCITPDECEEPVKNSHVQCYQQGTLCCSLVKEEFRTHCHHHGGQCMGQCPMTLTKNTIDCMNGEVCCVLV